MPDPYKTPGDMQDVYDEDAQKNKEFDDAVAGGTLEDLREGVKVKKRNRSELRSDMMKSIGFEVGANAVLDKATNWLLAAPFPGARPLYGAANFLGSAGINIQAQRIRGEEGIKWGEAGASGGMSLVPYMPFAAGKYTKYLGEPWSVQRGVVGGAVTGVGHESIRVGIDEKRLPSPIETGLSATVGGAVGGAIPAAADTAKRMIAQIRGISPMGDLAYGLGGTGGAGATRGGSVGPFRASYVEPEFEHTAKVLQRLFNNNLTTGGRERRFNFVKLQNDRTSQELINSNFRRQLGVDISTTEYYKIGQSFQNQRRDEMGIFTALYGDAMQNNKVRQINPTTGKPELVSSPIEPSQIELDHRVTLMQSLGMYHNTAYGSDLWNDIQRIALNRMDPRTGRGYKPGDTVDNLGLADPESHRVKSKFFNDLHGRSSGGMKYWRGKHRDTGMSRLDIMSNSHTDKTLNGKSYRDMHLEIVEDYFDHIDKGSKILDDALAIWDAEKRGDLVPDHIAETLGNVALNAETYDYTPTKLKEIVTDIILDTGPRRSKENWAAAFQEYPDTDAIDKIIWMNERSEAGMEAVVDVIFNRSTPEQALKKWKSLDQQIELPILKEAVKQAKANPDIIKLMQVRRGKSIKLDDQTGMRPDD